MFSIKQCCQDKMFWIDSQCQSTVHINIPYVFLETYSTHIGFHFSFYRRMGVLFWFGFCNAPIFF